MRARAAYSVEKMTSSSSPDLPGSGHPLPEECDHRESMKQSTQGKMKRAWNLLRLRRRLERELDKNRTLPAPFVSVRVRDKRESMRANLLLILAVMECICGFVFPICDAVALTDRWSQFSLNHKYYVETFLVSQYIGAILALAYMQALIYYYNTPNSQLSDTNGSVLSPNFRSPVESEHWNQHIESSKRKFRFSVTTVGHNGHAGHHTCFFCRKRYDPSTHKRYITWHREGMNLYMRLGAVSFGLGLMINDGFNLSSAWELGEPSCHSYMWIPTHVLRLVWVLWQTYFLFKYHRVLVHVHEFAVRTAFTHLAVVNLCHWLKVVVGEISSSLKHGYMDPVQGVDTTWTVASAPNVSATIDAQQVACVHDHEKNLSSFATFLNTTTHLLVENLTTWAPRVPVVNCKAHLGQMLKPFLFPLAIEYSLVSGTLFYKLLHRVGETDPDCPAADLGQQTASMPNLISPSSPSLCGLAHCGSVFGSPVEGNGGTALKPCEKHTQYRQLLGCLVYLPVELDDADTNAESTTGYDHSKINSRSGETPNINPETGAHCHRSHNGLFLGFMVFIATVIGIIFFLSFRKPQHLQYVPHIYLYTKITLLSISLFASLLAIIQTYPMRFRRVKPSENFEYNLLGLGLLGCLTYHMLLFVPALETLVHVILYQSTTRDTTIILTPSKLEEIKGTALLYIIKCSLEIFQASVQFFFIVETSRRGPCCPNQARIKPGRSAIVFLVITNLALWLINTFELRQTENQLALHREYYGKRNWSVITCCFIPLLIFFRFHSTVCLTQIWSALYKMK